VDGRRIPLMDRRQIRAVRCGQACFKENFLHMNSGEMLSARCPARSPGRCRRDPTEEAFRGIVRGIEWLWSSRYPLRHRCADDVDVPWRRMVRAGSPSVHSRHRMLFCGWRSEQWRADHGRRNLTHSTYIPREIRAAFLPRGTFVFPTMPARIALSALPECGTCPSMSMPLCFDVSCFRARLVRPDDPGSPKSRDRESPARKGSLISCASNGAPACRRTWRARRTAAPFYVEGGGFGETIINSPRKSQTFAISCGSAMTVAVRGHTWLPNSWGWVGRFDVDVAGALKGAAKRLWHRLLLPSYVPRLRCDRRRRRYRLRYGGVLVAILCSFNHKLRGVLPRQCRWKLRVCFLHGAPMSM
jgi:hypothetical protein